MNYYNTRKHLFETNFKNTKNNLNEFQFKHSMFTVLSQRSDDNYVYLDAVSDSTYSCCPTCNSNTSYKQDKKLVYPLMGTYNGKPIII